MKVLLLGDASNYHSCLASALRRQGCTVVVASHGSGWMDTRRDIDLSRGSSRLSGAWLFARLMAMTHTSLRGFDVVQLVAPVFATLRPERLRPLFDRIRRANGRVYTVSLEADPYYVEACTSSRPPLPFSEWHIGTRPSPMALANPGLRQSWLDLRPYYDYVFDRVDGVVTALYEYHKVCSAHIAPGRLAYGGIPVDLHSIPAPGPRPQGPCRIMAAYHATRMAEKGADILLDMARRIVARHPGRATLDIVTNLPYGQFIRRLADADIVLDQLYALSPATTALLAMANGAVPVTGGADDYYRFIGDDGIRPIVTADPFSLEQTERTLEHLVTNPDALAAMRAAARPFVARHNDADVVARRFIDFWNK